VSKLDSLAVRSVRASSQLRYLQTTRENGNIPRGIATQINFKCAVKDPFFIESCRALSQIQKSRMLDLVIDNQVIRSKSLRKSFYSFKNCIKASLPISDHENLESHLSTIMHNERLELLKRHHSKLQRDVDYAVYIAPSYVDNALPVKKRRKRKRKKVNRTSSHRHQRTLIKGTLPKVEDLSMDNMSRTVVNLTDKELTKEQLYVFFLSHKFAPTPPLPDLSRFENDLNTWFSKMRAKVVFDSFKCGPSKADKRVTDMERCLIKSEASRTFESCKNPALEAFIKCCRAEVDLHRPTQKYVSPDNIAAPIRSALKEVKGWKDVVIRPFDKGVGFFLLGEEDYIQRIGVHLNDRSVYSIVNNKDNLVVELIDVISNWTITFKDELGMSKKVKEWVIPCAELNQPGNMYLNPKAHKPPLYPGRMITTGCGSYIENLSALTAYELKKAVLDYRIIDTPHFLRKIDSLNESTVLLGKEVIHVAIDISNMFTNIPRDMGIQQCTKHLNERTSYDRLFSTECIISALEITLDYNIASFNGTTYRQERGAAMGPKNSCEYADCAMDKIDILVNEGDDEHGPPHRPAFWGRLRDDIYMAWPGTVEQLLEFMSWLNSIHKDLVFTYDYSTDGVEFLDTYVYAVGDVIHTKLYSKPSDTHCYLIPTSCHRNHVLKNIPYGVARRVRQNNSEDTNFLEQREVYTGYLMNRGYHPSIINDAFDKFSDLTYRKNLYALKDKDDTTTCLIPMVMDQNPALPNMGSIIHKYKHLLNLDPRLKKLVRADSVFVSHRKNQTIGGMLVHNKYRAGGTARREKEQENTVNQIPEADPASMPAPQGVDNAGCHACGKCYVCKQKFLSPCSEFSSHHSQQVFPINKYITCQSTNLIYLMECNTCNQSYVGYTTSNLPKRFSNHKSHIKKGIRSCRLVNHFLDIDHALDFSTTASFNSSLSAHLSVIIVDALEFDPEINKLDREKAMEAREGYYQTQLKTLERYGGMNSLDSNHILFKSAGA